MTGPAARVEGLIVEGLAIVSADGMIADASGIQPAGLLLEADQRFFRAMIEKADVLVHGRNSGEGGAGAERRKRIVLTRRIPALAPDPDNEHAVLWNPAGAPFGQAWTRLGLRRGRAIVIGGTEAFGLFLQTGYDMLHLSRAGQTRLPGGKPVFPGVPEKSPEELLTQRGLRPDPAQMLDARQGLTLTTWRT